MASAYGGLNVIRFHKDGKIGVKPLGLTDEQRQTFEQRLMVFYTGTSRLSSSLSKQLVDNLGIKAKNLLRMARQWSRKLVDMLHHSDHRMLLQKAAA